MAAGSSQGRASGLGVEGPYAALLGELLGAMREGLRGADAGAARRVLVDAPCLPEGAVGAWLRGAGAGGAPWAGLALAACRDVMLLHPPCRAWVLGAVLGAATGEDEDARDKAGRLVRNRLWEEGTLRGMVEEAVVGELEGVARGTGEGQGEELCMCHCPVQSTAYVLFNTTPPRASPLVCRAAGPALCLPLPGAVHPQPRPPPPRLRPLPLPAPPRPAGAAPGLGRPRPRPGPRLSSAAGAAGRPAPGVGPRGAAHGTHAHGGGDARAAAGHPQAMEGEGGRGVARDAGAAELLQRQELLGM